MSSVFAKKIIFIANKFPALKLHENFKDKMDLICSFVNHKCSVYLF